MTREQAKQALIGMGVAEPSEEQVSKLLDSISAETKKEKDKNVSLKEKAEKADSLEKELEELKKQNMTEAERLEAERKKEKEAVDKELADLKAALAESNQKPLPVKLLPCSQTQDFQVKLTQALLKHMRPCLVRNPRM